MDLRKLESEVDPKRSFEVFETLRADTNLFTNWSRVEIEKLCENIKIISYGRSATIIRKNELIEYFAIVLGGKLLINQGDNVIGHLGPGDVIGYMAYLDFGGTKASPFEITADVEGYIAVLRYDEFKMLSKKEPALTLKITDMLGKKALNTVALQYMGEEVYTPFKLKGSSAVTNTKKVKDAMDTCPELLPFFERLDQRDRKNLTKSVDLIEFDREQKVIHEGKKADYILILTKGELISFRDNKPAVYYKPGTILGIKEFSFGLSWQENVLGKAKGVMLKLDRSKFEEMVLSSPQSANSLLKSLIWYECKTIKSKYQDRSLFEKTKTTNVGAAVNNPLNEFVEYEITKHLDFINKQQLKMSSTKPLIKEFMLKKEVLPLYMHNIHQSLVPQVVEIDGKKAKVPETIAGCIFLREKMEKQLAEKRNKKAKDRTAARPAKAPEHKKHEDKAGDEDYEDLKNNFVLLERENEELRSKMNDIFEDNKNLKNQIKTLKELSVTSGTQINKSLLHKELMTKDLINNDPSSFLTRNYNTAFSTFGDVLKEQHIVAMRTKRVAKYAYRWLAIVRTRRKLVTLGKVGKLPF